MKKVNVVYVNTRYFLGMCYGDKRRIEISCFIKKYTELHDHVLKHELKHQENRDLHGSWSVFYDILLEFRSEFTEVFNEKIRLQRKEYDKDMDVGFKEDLLDSLYMLSFPFYKLFGTFLLAIRFFWRPKN